MAPSNMREAAKLRQTKLFERPQKRSRAGEDFELPSTKVTKHDNIESQLSHTAKQPVSDNVLLEPDHTGREGGPESADEQVTKGPPTKTPEPDKFTPKHTDDGPSKVVERIGDLFDAPDFAVLIHACNCKGSWGGGIAIPFKQKYPKAFNTYHNHCVGPSKGAKTGTALLIPPSETKGPKHYIGCLYTSDAYGFRKDSPGKILANTRNALQHLLAQIAQVQQKEKITELRMCQINSGKFGVPWPKTLAIVREVIDEAKTDLRITTWMRE